MFPLPIVVIFMAVETLDDWFLICVVGGRVCTKQRGRLGRQQGWFALVPDEAAAMRRVQAPIRGCVNWESIIYVRPWPLVDHSASSYQCVWRSASTTPGSVCAA
jgi:hypothetical protein